MLSFCSSIPHLCFLPYGQVGVGIPGGLETAIRITHHYITQHSSDSSLGLLKINIKMHSPMDVVI